MKSKRQDPHRPGAIVPSDYEYQFSYSLAHTYQGMDIPPIGLEYFNNIPADRMANIWPGRFQCDVCGMVYIHGDCWLHRPSGEYITLGHECASKYEMFINRSDWKVLRGRAIDRAKKAAERHRLWAKYREQLRRIPDLGVLLKLDHYIAQDIRARFIQWASITDKQIDLLRSIKQRLDNPPVLKPAPVGRKIVEGEVVSVKVQDGYYGQTIKMLVQCDGFKAWGTVPDILLNDPRPLKGRKVRFNATFEQSKTDESFAYFKRPTKAEYLDNPPNPEDFYPVKVENFIPQT